jgi:hypothetical protein
MNIISSDAAYSIISPTGENRPILWTKPTSPGPAPEVLDQGTAAQISAVRHSWEEAVLTHRIFKTVQHVPKKQIITVFDPMHLGILNEDMVVFTNITSQEMFDNLFLTYGNIIAVDLENNFEQMRKAWDPQQPVETLFKQIQDCANFLETVGVLIGHPQQINVEYAKTFATGNFMSDCRRWNDKDTADKTWENFKVHFAIAHRQHQQIQMQGKSAANAGDHASNTAVVQT